MKRHITLSLSILLLMLNYIPGAQAQPFLKQRVISFTSGNLRVDTAVVLQTVVLNQHVAGAAVVRFDGTCFSDSGDIIVVAASNTNFWLSNDGNEGLEAANAISRSRSFSHTRVYNVGAGTDTFYALAQNYVNTGGSGMASIYGHLTVEFFPTTGAGVVRKNISASCNLAAGMVAFDSITLPSAQVGKVFVHLDGQLFSDAGDRIMLSVNYMPEWTVDDGSVACRAANTSENISPYLHTRVYDIASNPNTYYAVGENVVDQGGTGNVHVYGGLSAELFPTGGSATLDSKGIVVYAQNLISSPGPLDSITISPTQAGKVLVQFDGYCSSSYGDQLELAASNTRDCADHENSATIAASSPDNVFNVFSHSQLYTVAPGTYTFYCIAKITGTPAGSGVADVLGNFSAKYYAVNTTSIPQIASSSNFEIYPNPAKNTVIIVSDNSTGAPQLISVTDITGRTLVSEITDAAKLQLNISTIPAGLYLVRCGNQVKRLVIQ